MGKVGLHIVKKTQESGGLSWTRNELWENGKLIKRMASRPNSLGAYVSGGTLYIDGEPVATGASINPNVDHNTLNNDTSASFGGVELEQSNKCINITQENYGHLLAGDVVAGYKSFDPDEVYNIVEDVATASVITYDKTKTLWQLTDGIINTSGHRCLIYNNLVGTLAENSLSDNTFIRPDLTPQLSIHDCFQRLAPGANLEFTYMVDSHDLKKQDHDDISSTFTVIVKDKYGNVLFKNTTYAGEFTIRLKPFKNGLGSSTNEASGTETWFSIEAIESHGVGSVVKYFDIFITDDVDIPKTTEAGDSTVYDVEAMIGTDITATTDANDKVTALSFSHGGNTYTLSLDDDDMVKSYNNKAAFTALFAKAKAAGKKRIKLYNADTSENGTPTKYYINLHKAIGNDPTAADYFGKQTYWVHKVLATQTGVDDDNNPVYAYSFDTDYGTGGKKEINSTNFTFDTGETAVDFIKRDGAEIYRVTEAQATSGMHILGGNAIEPSAEGKIWVRWRDATYQDDDDWGYLSVYDSDNEQFVGFQSSTSGDFNDIPYLRTYKKSVIEKSGDASSVNENFKKSGYFYVVENTMDFDCMSFPDDFVIDMNGCVWQAKQHYGLQEGRIVFLKSNFNTHIVNGNLVGTYKNFDFIKGAFAQGISGKIVSEGVSNSRIWGSRYCSMQHIDSSWSLCYDNITDNDKDGINSGGLNETNFYSSGNYDGFSKVGYIGLSGDVVPYSTPLRGLNDGNTNNPDYSYSGGTDEGLVYHNQYLPINFKYKKTGASAYTNADEFVMSSIYTIPFCCGKRHEYFVSFYERRGESPNYTYHFIRTVKAQLWSTVKMPAGATHFRLSAYGITKMQGNNRVSAIKDYGSFKINGAFYKFSISASSSLFSRGILFKNNSYHDSRSSSLSMESAVGSMWDNCTFRRIACIPYTDWFVTKLLGATEDGRFFTALFTIKNCSVTRDYPYGTTSTTISDVCSFRLIYCKDFSMHGCTGFVLSEEFGVRDAYVVNNDFVGLKIIRKKPVHYPHLVNRGNTIRTTNGLSGEYSSNVNEILKDKATATTAEKQRNVRLDRCDEPISNVQTIEDTLSVADDSYLGEGVVQVRYKRSKIGNNEFK